MSWSAHLCPSLGFAALQVCLLGRCHAPHGPWDLSHHRECLLMCTAVLRQYCGTSHDSSDCTVLLLANVAMIANASGTLLLHYRVATHNCEQQHSQQSTSRDAAWVMPAPAFCCGCLLLLTDHPFCRCRCCCQCSCCHRCCCCCASTERPHHFRQHQPHGPSHPPRPFPPQVWLSHGGHCLPD